MRRVGHKGADLIAPGNTVASFDAALDAGVDMIEFDVLLEDRNDPTSRLLLAHDYRHCNPETALTFEEGLSHLADHTFNGVEFDVDLKLPGYEDRVVQALREHGLVERTLVSSQFMHSLKRVRALEPDLRIGWSVPRVRRDYTQHKLYLVPALAALSLVKRTLPGRAVRALEAGLCDAMMVHHRLVTPALVEAIRKAGGELYVWTVDDQATIRRLEALGVTGVISNDPRLFGARV